MIILYGWGNRSKKLADAGYLTCGHCNNVSWFTIIYLASEFNLYYIPVARWNRRYYMVCGICSAGYEIDNQKIKDVIADSKGIPDFQTYDLIWHKLLIMWDEFIIRYNKNGNIGVFKDWDKEAFNRLKLDGFGETSINYVLKNFNSLTEENLSKTKNIKTVTPKELTEKQYFYCRHCGNKLDREGMFCNNCDQKILS